MVSERTIKKLWLKSGNQCAHPDCEQELIDFDEDTIIGRMCHIRGKNPGSARYDPEMDDGGRNSQPNLLLLCPNHHTIVDGSPDNYPPELLEKWKEQHEIESGDTRELTSEQIEKVVFEIQPEMLLVYIQEEDLDVLQDVIDWEPSRTYPEEKDEHGQYPIVVSFDDLKSLLGRVAATFRQDWNGEPIYKQSSDWSEEKIIAASATAAYITKNAIQYYQVESERRFGLYFENQ